MNWTLGIDTASTELGLGLFADQKTALVLSRHTGYSHAEQITKSFEYLLQSSALSIADISHIGVTVGPGSFTGLRIGIGFIKGAFFASRVKIHPISSLESLAAAWPGKTESLVVALDARRGDIFWARFSNMGTTPTRLTVDTISPMSIFLDSLSSADTVICDTLGFSQSTLCSEIGTRCTIHQVDTFPLQRGLACARIAAHAPADSNAWLSPVDLEPLYMRASAPEEKASTLLRGSP